MQGIQEFIKLSFYPLVSLALYFVIRNRPGQDVVREKDSSYPSIPNPEYLMKASNFCYVFIIHTDVCC